MSSIAQLRAGILRFEEFGWGDLNSRGLRNFLTPRVEEAPFWHNSGEGGVKSATTMKTVAALPGIGTICDFCLSYCHARSMVAAIVGIVPDLGETET